MSEATLLTLAVLAFGSIIVVAQVTVMIRRNRGWGSNSTRIVGFTVVLVVVIVLALSSISMERFLAVLGIIGTIVGYLAGRKNGETDQ